MLPLTIARIALLIAAPLAPNAVPARAEAPPSGAVASYVRICRDARGSLDRRACHRRDAGASALAMNF